MRSTKQLEPRARHVSQPSAVLQQTVPWAMHSPLQEAKSSIGPARIIRLQMVRVRVGSRVRIGLGFRLLKAASRKCHKFPPLGNEQTQQEEHGALGSTSCTHPLHHDRLPINLHDDTSRSRTPTDGLGLRLRLGLLLRLRQELGLGFSWGQIPLTPNPHFADCDQPL